MILYMYIYIYIHGQSESELDHLVAQLHSEGFSDQLSWLEAYLRDEARDRRADGEETLVQYMTLYYMYCTVL